MADNGTPPPCVPFIAWRCPTCGNAKPRTYGRKGRVRYHECQCGTNFRSVEYEGQQLHGAAQAEPIVCLSAQLGVADDLSASFSERAKQRLEVVERRRSNVLADQDIDEAERVLEGWRVRLAVMRTDRRMVDGAAPLPDDLDLLERAVAERPRRAKA